MVSENFWHKYIKQMIKKESQTQHDLMNIINVKNKSELTRIQFYFYWNEDGWLQKEKKYYHLNTKK